MCIVWLVCFVVLFSASSSLRPSDDRLLDEDLSAALDGALPEDENNHQNASAPQLRKCTCCASESEVSECNAQQGYACLSNGASEIEEWKIRCCFFPQHETFKFSATGDCNTAASTPALQDAGESEVALIRDDQILNAKQKSWAAERILNLEHRKCGRHNFPISRTWKKPWESCPSGYNRASPITCRSCNGEDEGPFACWEKCGKERNLPQLPHRCTNLYCTASEMDCVAKVTDIVVSWAKVAINLIVVNTQGLESIKAVVEGARDMISIKALLIGALKPTVMNIISMTGNSLREYMKNDKLTAPTMEAIIRGGAEIVALSAVAGLIDSGINLFKDVLQALDFTGIVKAISAFDGGERCRDLMVTPMPTDGLVDEQASH
eukprot:TRINITY_DN5000_c0_g1_i1.p1 TRINITY_DN5000_c0_g1~~TRINITY_DN5000_c0_g1_i1.p1  ORF type:complete len:379 (-),score=34.59 TRINITY_DN5000_c0_g1_i1:141-1277(-)